MNKNKDKINLITGVLKELKGIKRDLNKLYAKVGKKLRKQLIALKYRRCRVQTLWIRAKWSFTMWPK
jgi:hypothetical protein